MKASRLHRMGNNAKALSLAGILLFVLVEIGLLVMGSDLTRPLAIGLILLVPPNALMVFLKVRWPGLLGRRHFAMLSSLLFFFWLIGIILLLSAYRWLFN